MGVKNTATGASFCLGYTSGTISGSQSGDLNYSVSLWCRLDSSLSTNQVGAIWCKGNPDDETEELYFYNPSGSATDFHYYDNSPMNNSINGGANVPTGVWHHLAHTRGSGGVQTYYTYLDGVQVDTGSDSCPALDGATPYGYYLLSDGESEYCPGSIAAVKMWNTQLSQAEILAEQYQFLPKRTANLWAFWPLLDITNLEDRSGNGRNLTALSGSSIASTGNPPIAWTSNPIKLTSKSR